MLILNSRFSPLFSFGPALTPYAQHSIPSNSHYGLRIWIRRSSEATLGGSGPLNPVYRHRLFTHEDIFIAKFPIDLNLTTSLPGGSGGGRKDGNNKTDDIGGGKNKSKAVAGALVNTIIAPSPPAVLAIPEDISDHKHTLTAKVGGVDLKYTITYVCIYFYQRTCSHL